MRRTVVVIATVAALAAGCTDAGDVESTTAPPPSTSSTIAGEVTESLPSTTVVLVRPGESTTTTPPPSATTTTTTTAPTTTTTTPAPPTTTIVPVPGPIPGSPWSVVGVPHDDALNVRAAPGALSPVVGTLAPTTADVRAEGDAALVGRVIWWRVSVEAFEGWVSSRYLAGAGTTDDVTSAVVSANAGVRPSAPSMEELASLVVELRGAGEHVVVAPPGEAEGIGEVLIDRFVEGDDAIRGERLRIFGQRLEEGGSFGLYAVESTSLCWRAVDDEGLCV